VGGPTGGQVGGAGRSDEQAEGWVKGDFFGFFFFLYTGRWAGRRTCTVGVKVDETVPVGQLGGQTERSR
jgi:hypothetical protein